MELIVTLTGIGHEDGGEILGNPLSSLPLGAPSLEAGWFIGVLQENLPSPSEVFNLQ